MPSSNTPLLNLSLLIDVTFSTPTPHYTHLPIPAKRFDVKRIESSRNLSAIAC